MNESLERPSHRPRISSVLLSSLVGLLSAFVSMAETDSSRKVETLGPISPHSVWVTDRVLAHSLMYDGDSGRVLASIDSHNALTPKVPLWSPRRGEIYSVDIDYSRGRRGNRIDYVTIYDAETLEVVGEVVLPHPTAESNASITQFAMLDDERFLLAFSQFPETIVTVVDLESRRVAAEVPIAGCAGVYPVGPLSFATLCGDGTTSRVLLDAEGRFVETARSEPFFDVITDPVAVAAARFGSSWFFVTFGGRVHPVDYADARPAPREPWSLASEREREDGWRPGGLQHVAIHQETGRLYVVMHQGGRGSHKDPGPEVWVYDLGSRERIDRFETPNLMADFLVPLLELEAGGFADRLMHWITTTPGVHSIVVTQDESPLLFARHADFGIVAVLDAVTGDHVRNLEEAGITGPSLGVP